jgi:C1A family cysteine protease
MDDKVYSLGSLDPKIDLRDFSYEPTDIDGLPLEFDLWCPKVKNQKDVGSCVAHAAAQIEEYFNHKEGKPHKDLSVGYIYGCRYNYKGQGMYVRDALKTLHKRGICEHYEFPYNKEVPDIIDLFTEADQLGWTTDSAHCITSYFAIKGKDEELINKVKRSLINNGPVMISVPWYDDFKVIDGVINSPSNMKGKSGGHCMYLYGWDERGWKIQNSWGTLWGIGGRAIYPYNYPVKEFWGVTDTYTDNIKKKDYNKFSTFFIKIANVIINFIRKLTFKK